MSSTYKLYSILLLALTVCTRAAADDGRMFFEINSANGLADNSAQTIRCTKTGRMVVTTIGNINFYDGVQFSHINSELENAYPLPYYHGHYHLYFDLMHHLWMKSSSGVNCVDLMTERFILNVDSVFQEIGMMDKVMDMFVDIDGHLWLVGKNYVWGQYYDKRFPILAGANLQDLDVVDGRRLMLFYDNGELMEFDVKTDKVLYRGRIYGEEDVARYNKSGVMLKHGNGYYIIRNGSDDAILLHLDLKTHKWTTVIRPDFHLNNMVVHDDMLYIASAYGYLTFDTKTGETTHVRELRLSNGRKILTDINDIEFDKQGGMWLGTEKRGLLYSRAISSPFKSLTWEDPLAVKYSAMMDEMEANNTETDKLIPEFNGKKATVMYIDSRDWTWIGTTTGLRLYKTPQADPVLITRRNGLMNNVIHSIIEDDLHNVWVATSWGISCVLFDADTLRYVMSYTNLDNVPNETFVNGRTMKLEDGTIVMQALDHVVTFNPKNFTMLKSRRYFKLYPKLTKLLVNGTFVEPGMEVDGSVILDKAVTRLSEINVNYNQNTISMTFSGLNYLRPLQTYYRVRVKGLYDDWQVLSYANSDGKIDSRGQLHLPLTSLKPGTYEVYVQASFFPDQWEVEPFRWVIHVNEPWWRTSGMLALLGVILLVLAIVNFILYNRNTRLKIQRSNEEGDVIRRIKSFVERCDSYSDNQFVQTQDELFGDSYDSQSELADEFVNAMTSIVPYVHQLDGRSFSMRNLCDVTGLNFQQLYGLVSTNIYKSPRLLARTLKVQEAAEMLIETDRTVEEIANDCNFMSPNYFIASFYHVYKKTPTEYRKKNR